MDLPPLPQPQPLGADEIRSLDQWELDDRVWLGLLDLLRSRPGGESESEVIMAWPSARRIYFLTRSLEWEVANGGFNQYFFNPGSAYVSETIGCYEELGKPEWASIVREAAEVAGGEAGLREAHRDGTIESFFETYDESQLDEFDERFEVIPWGDEIRIELVRSNPADFVITAADLGIESE